MAKLLLNSIVIATLVLPMYAARDRSPARGLRRAVLWVIGFNLFYVLSVIHLYPRLL